MNKGFIATTMTLSVAGTLLALVGASSLQSALFFDQALRKEYRAINYYNALNCIDQVILELAHDFFFTTAVPITLKDLDCTILSVAQQGDQRIIVTRGDLQKTYVYRSAIVRMKNHDLDVVKIE